MNSFQKKMRYASQKYWDKNFDYFNQHYSHKLIIKNILKFIKGQDIDNCFEVGCFPGGFLERLGKLGIEINGIDLNPKTKNLEAKFTSKGYRVGEITHGDFTEHCKNTQKRYDLVMSMGFIEHFEDYIKIIGFHGKLVNPGGLLFITVPNFSGKIQRWLHSMFDDENMLRHNLNSMNPKEWEKFLIKKGFEIKFCGYLGGFDFWVEKQNRSYLEEMILGVVLILKSFFRWIPAHKSYSPHILLVARKDDSLTPKIMFSKSQLSLK